MSLSLLLAFMIDMFVTQMSQKYPEDNFSSSQPDSGKKGQADVVEDFDGSPSLNNTHFRPPQDSVSIIEHYDTLENELNNYHREVTEAGHNLEAPLLRESKVL